MKPESAIKKGKRFEKMIAREIEDMGLGIAREERGSGSGKYKGDIAANLPFLLECKNQKKLAWWDAIDQAKRQAKQGNWDQDKWALVIRDQRSPESSPIIYTVMDFWQFLELLKKNSEPLVKAPDRELKWKILRLIADAKAVLRDLE